MKPEVPNIRIVFVKRLLGYAFQLTTPCVDGTALLGCLQNRVVCGATSDWFAWILIRRFFLLIYFQDPKVVDAWPTQFMGAMFFPNGIHICTCKCMYVHIYIYIQMYIMLYYAKVYYIKICYIVLWYNKIQSDII